MPISPFDFLLNLKIVASIFPIVEAPDKRIPFRQKTVWTGAALLVFLVLSETPVAFLAAENSAPLYPYSKFGTFCGANPQTVLEFGILPVLSSLAILKTFVAFRKISLNPNTSEMDRGVFAGLVKVIAVILTLVYCFGGSVISLLDSSSSVWTSLHPLVNFPKFLIVCAQYCGVTTIICILVELVGSGWGVGSDLTICALFCAANCTKWVAWNALSTSKVSDAYYGAIPNAFSAVWNFDSKIEGMSYGFYRSGLPNLWGIVALIVIGIALVFMQNFRVDVNVKNSRVRGHSASFPIRLFYTSHFPICVLLVFWANALFVMRLIHAVVYFLTGADSIVYYLFSASVCEFSSQSIVPTNGFICRILIGPQMGGHFMLIPLYTAMNIALLATFCSVASKYWVKISGKTSSDVAEDLRAQSIGVRGYRDSSVDSVLDRHIPTASLLGGAIIGVLVGAGDLIGVSGGGVGVVLGVLVVLDIFEQMYREGGAEFMRMFG